MNTNKSTIQVRLRNKLTGLYYVEGKKNFSGTESDAAICKLNSPYYLAVKYTFENVQAVEVSCRRRVTKRKDGIEKIELLSFGSTGRNFYGEPARGHWVVKGYKKDCVFRTKLKDLRAELRDGSHPSIAAQ